MRVSGVVAGALRTMGMAAVVLGVAACASVPPPPADAAPPLSPMERIGQPGVVHSSIIEAVGTPSLAGAAVADGGVLATVGYRYRHTAVLTRDVMGFSITVPGVQAPAGAPGYYAGTFTSSGLHQGAGSMELWCFLPGAVGGKREHLCLLRQTPSLAAIAPTRMNPYLWLQFAPASGTFDYVVAPVFERREVVIPGDLKLEYRFDGWSAAGAAKLGEFAVGRKVRDFEIAPDARGEIRLRTVAGEFVIAHAATDPTQATISAVLERTT